MWHLHPLILSKKIQQNTNHRIHNAIVRKITTYGAEKWILNKGA